MKWILFMTLFAFAACEETDDPDDLKCNLKICGSELLNFETFSFSDLFRKMELASFCVKNCTPPVVHEFFQSIIYGITRRIPGHCSGEECVDKNRFVALAQCVEQQAWPLLQCTKRLIDLAQNILVHKTHDSKLNTTCSIASETTQCIEEQLQRCGDQPFGLVKEIAGDLVKAGINAYCHPAYRKEGLFIKRTTAIPTSPLPSGQTPEPIDSSKPHPQYVKGYRTNGAWGMASSSICMCTSLVITALLSIYYLHR